MQVLEINDRYSKNLKKVMAAWEAENLEELEEEERRSQNEAPARQLASPDPTPTVHSQSEEVSDAHVDDRAVPQEDDRPVPQQTNSLSDWILNSEQGLTRPVAPEETPNDVDRLERDSNREIDLAAS